MSEHGRADDEKLASLMKRLPQRPLPPGFMQRLERKRRAQEAPAAKSPYLLPFPVRVAAFALSSLIVSLVVWDKVRVTLPFSGAAGLVSGDAASHLPPVALSETDVEQARARGTGRRLLRARGEPIDALRAAEVTRKEEAARILGASQPSNEELQAGLERQKKAMGLRRIEAPPPPEVAAELKLRAGVDAQLLKGAPPAAPLGDASTPALLSQPETADAKPLPRPAGAPVAFAAAAAAPAAAEGLLLKSADERVKAWSEHGMHAAPPSVNFGVNMIALVVAPDLKTAVEIIGVSTHADKVVVRYRLFPRLAEVASAARSGAQLVRAYQFRVIPRTDKPVVFDRVE